MARDREVARSVDVKSRAEVRGGDFDQLGSAESADEPARALVACEAHRRLEQASPEEHGIAAPATKRRRCGKRPLLRQEGVNQGVDQPRLDPRHVAEQHNRAHGVGRQGGNADPERGGEAARKRRIEGDPDVEARERGLDRVPRVANDDDDWTRPRRERRFRSYPHDRLAVELRDELRCFRAAGGAKARRLSRGQYDGADPSQRKREVAGARRSP